MRGVMMIGKQGRFVGRRKKEESVMISYFEPTVMLDRYGASNSYQVLMSTRCDMM